MSKEAVQAPEAGEEKKVIESPFQKAQMQAAFKRILSAGGIEIAIEVGKIKPNLESKFKIYIANKDIGLEDLRARKIECVTVLRTIQNNNTSDKLKEFEKLFKSFNKRIDNKIEKIKRNLGIVETEKAIDLKDIPDLMAQEISVDEPEPLFPQTPEPAESSNQTPKDDTQTTDTPDPIFDAQVEVKAPNVDKAKTDDTPQPQPENKTEGAQEKRLHITTLENLTTFIKETFPKIDTQITSSQGKYILKATISVLMHASQEAKSKGKDEILKLLTSAEEFQVIMQGVETKDIRESSKANLAQDISKELTKLKKALNEKLTDIERRDKGIKEVPTLNSFEEVETFLNKDLIDSEILPENIKDLHAKIYEIIDTTTIQAEKEGEKPLRALGNKLIAIEKNLEHLVSRDKDKIKTKEQEKLVKDLLSTFNFIFAKVDAAIKDFAKEEDIKREKKEKKPSPINSIRGILNFVTKKLAEIPEAELGEKKREISNAFTTEFDNLRDDDEPSALILRGEILRLRQALDSSSNFQGAKAELIKTLSGVTEEFLKAIKRKSDPTTSSKENKATSQDNKESEQDAQTENKSNIEDLIDVGDGQFPEHASPEIKKDKNFNVWLQKVHERSIKEDTKIPPRTWSEWHATFKEQKLLLDKIDSLRNTPAFEEKIYGKFDSKEDREAIKKISREILSFDLLFDAQVKQKLETIIAQDESIKLHEAEIKKLEEEKTRMEKDYTTNTMKLSDEVVFKSLYGDESDSKRIQDFDGFLTDMNLNYKHYKSASNEESTDELADMFALYNKGRKSPYTYQTGKIGKIKGFLKKLRFAVGTNESDYDDKRTFMGKIRALRDVGVLESKKSIGVDSEKNMRDLIEYVKLIKNSVENGGTIEEFLNNSTDDREKKLFLDVFPKYTKSITENSRIQSAAKSLAKKTAVFEQIETKVKIAKDKSAILQKEQEDGLVGSDAERAEFEDLMNQELADVRLTDILTKIEGRVMDSNRLQKLNMEFATIKEEHAEPSLYRRVSLKLSREEIKLVVSGKDIQITEESVMRHDVIFDEDNVTPQEKVAFAEAMLKILNQKVAKLTDAEDTVERIGMKKIINYYEDKKSMFK